MSENIEKLIAQTRDKTIIVGAVRRRDAVKKLSQIGTPQTVIPLIQSLEDEDKEVKKLAFLGLSSLTDKTAREVLRNYYLKNRNKALWQIIKKNAFYPDDLFEKMLFFARARAYDEARNHINPETIEEQLKIILLSEEEETLDVMKMITEVCGDESQMKIIKLFLETKDKRLFEIIDYKNWYPPDLEKKLIFILKTDAFEKLKQMLDGEDFRGILDIIVDPKFPLKQKVKEALSTVENPFVIDEVCSIFIREKTPILGRIIMEQGWSPSNPRDRIFFYLETGVLEVFFLSRKVDPKLIGGYLEIPEIKNAMELEKEKLEELGKFFESLARSLAESQKPEIPSENPLDELLLKINRYLESPHEQSIIEEICDEYLENRSPCLEYLIVQMDWAPGDIKDKVRFFILTNQVKNILKLGETAVAPLYRIISDEDNQYKEKAIEVMSLFRSSKVIEKIFALYFTTKNKDIENIILKNQWLPKDVVEKALFFIFSGQADRYQEIEPEGHEIIFNAYKTLNVSQRSQLLDHLIQQESKGFTDFLLQVLTCETHPQLLRTISEIIPRYFREIYHTLRRIVRNIDGTALEFVVKQLYKINNSASQELMYEIAKVKMGYTCFWILKLLDDLRWQPVNTSERSFFYELFKLRDKFLRLLQMKIVDSNPVVREMAAMEFHKIGDEREVGTLLKYAEDPEERVHLAIGYSLGRLCALAPEQALHQIDSFRIGTIFMIFNDVRKALMDLPDLDRIAILGRNYRIGKPVLRAFSIAVLEGFRLKESIPTLLEAIEDNKPQIKKTALKALTCISDEKGQEAIYRMIEDGDQENRMMSARALGKLKNPEHGEKFYKRLSSNDYSYAESLVTALGLIDPAQYREYIEGTLRRPDFGFEGKLASGRILGEIGNEKTKEVLLEMLKSMSFMSTEDLTAIPFIEGLGIMGAGDAVHEILRYKDSSDWKVREAVIRALGNIPERSALVSVVKGLDDETGKVQLTALEALQNYMNKHFRFKGTEKDLQFLAAIIGRLKNFKLNAFPAPEFEHTEILTRLSIILLTNRLTLIYYQSKKTMEEGGSNNAE